ncbi:NEQ148 [Nanoarchaeum equitans Kin4-M]|uniref:NEQ148 n=1 Tax=Nanoarchaeum equitans (strain Kin4-M) TaxID=228908 RepID=Q74NB0_NANEQ|nr:NEQ148 [Nanoarchaeum equitans Kin4-M]
MHTVIAIRLTKNNRNAFSYLLGALEKQGFDINEIAIARSFEDLIKTKPKIVLYSFYSTEVWEVKKEIQMLKSKINAIAIAGGYHASAMPRHTLKMGFDIAVVGEGEETLYYLLENLKKNKAINKDLLTIRGLAFNLNGYKFTGFAKVEDFYKYPPFAESIRMVGPIEISRGCPFGCNYCQTPFFKGFRMRHRPIDQIVKHSRYLRDMRYISPNAFAYGSPGAILVLEKLEALLRALQPLRKEGRRLFFGTFPSEVRPEFVIPETLELLLKYADNRKIIIGAQSGDNRILKLMHRLHDVETIKRAVEYSIEYGFTPIVDFIVGTPYEDEESDRNTIELMKWIISKGGKVRAHYFMPLPGTPWALCKPKPLSKEMVRFLGTMARQSKLEGEWVKQIELSNKLHSLIKENYEEATGYYGPIPNRCINDEQTNKNDNQNKNPQKERNN